MHLISSHSYYQAADFATPPGGTPGWGLKLFLIGCRARVLKPLPISNLHVQFFSLKNGWFYVLLLLLLLFFVLFLFCFVLFFKIFANLRDPFLRVFLPQKWLILPFFAIFVIWDLLLKIFWPKWDPYPRMNTCEYSPGRHTPIGSFVLSTPLA